MAVPQPGSNDRHEEYQAISSKLRDLALIVTGLGGALAARLNLNRNDLRALDILIEQRTYELDAFVKLLFLAELVADFDLEPTGLREWLDGLDAPVVRARQDPGQPILGERSDQIGCLLPPAFVERTPAISA